GPDQASPRSSGRVSSTRYPPSAVGPYSHLASAPNLALTRWQTLAIPTPVLARPLRPRWAGRPPPELLTSMVKRPGPSSRAAIFSSTLSRVGDTACLIAI